VSSRSWEDTLDMLHDLEAMLRRDDAPAGAERAALLAQFAAGLAARDHLMDGPMPAEIETFVNQYHPDSRPTSPSDQRQAAPSDRNQQQAPDPDPYPDPDPDA